MRTAPDWQKRLVVIEELATRLEGRGWVVGMDEQRE